MGLYYLPLLPIPKNCLVKIKAHRPLNSETMKYTPIDNQLFINNRNNLADLLPSGAMAVLNSNDLMPRTADQDHTFRQNSDLFFLSGIDQEMTKLILYPNCPLDGYEEVLFLRKTDEHIAIWEGHKYTKEEARQVSGIRKIMWIDEFDGVLKTLMNQATDCFLNLNEHGRYKTQVPYADLRFASKMKELYPLHNFRRAAPLLTRLRAVKSDLEIELMKSAIEITNKAFRRILKFIKPGVMEYEIEAEIMHEFIRNRATGPAYSSIIASGPNACVLHYVDNNQECKDGEVILMDFGAEYANYAADLTRSIPVNGRYSDRQRQVYDAVLRVVDKATNMLRPGTFLDEYHKEVGKIMESELVGLGLLDAVDIKNQNPAAPLYKKYFMHGTSHFLGLDVHDVGDKTRPIQAGNVFTVEPGIYIQEEGLGIRIENDVLVTEEKTINLMADIPIEAEHIEELMNTVAV